MSLGPATPLLQTLQCLPLFFRIKSSLVSTALSHPILPQPHLQALSCPRAFALLFTLPGMFPLTQPFQLKTLFHSLAFSSNITSLKSSSLTFLLPSFCYHNAKFNSIITLITVSICLAYLLVYLLSSSSPSVSPLKARAFLFLTCLLYYPSYIVCITSKG